jgi:hypothetical protein
MAALSVAEELEDRFRLLAAAMPPSPAAKTGSFWFAAVGGFLLEPELEQDAPLEALPDEMEVVEVAPCDWDEDEEGASLGRANRFMSRRCIISWKRPGS